MAKNGSPSWLSQSPHRVWIAMLPALLLSVGWIAMDWANHRSPEYYLVDGGVLLACFLVMLGGYALVRRFVDKAK